MHDAIEATHQLLNCKPILACESYVLSKDILWY